MRFGTRSHAPESRGTAAVSLGSCRDLFGVAVVALLMVALSSRPALGQQGWWTFGFGGTATANTAADSLADYMYTGHTPHPAVARIVAPESGGASLGSGVLVDVNQSQGLVLTNWHVVRDSRSAVLVQFPDGFQSAGTVVRQDEAWDLAAIVIWKPSATPIPIADTPPQIGERLTIAGFGRGIYREESGECTEYLSPGTGYAKEFVELKATARQGDSGGPIFNDRREVAGVLFGQNDGRTIGSCSKRLREFLASVGSKGYTPTASDVAEAGAIEHDGPTVAAHGDRLAAVSVSDVAHRPAALAEPASAVVAQASPVPMPATPPPAWPMPPSAQQPSPLAGLGLPPWLPDPWVHRSTLLSGAGGLALVMLGLKTMLGGRRS